MPKTFKPEKKFSTKLFPAVLPVIPKCEFSLMSYKVRMTRVTIMVMT